MQEGGVQVVGFPIHLVMVGLAGVALEALVQMAMGPMPWQTRVVGVVRVVMAYMILPMAEQVARAL